MNSTTELATIKKLKDLKTILSETCHRKNIKLEDIEWVGSNDGEFALSMAQFDYFGSYLIRGNVDIAEDFSFILKDGSAYSFFDGEEPDIEQLQQPTNDNWVSIIAPLKTNKTLTPYSLFDLNNFRPVPKISEINKEENRHKIFVLNIDLVKLWNTLVDHNFVFNVVIEDLLNPPMKGTIHTKAFEGVKVGDVMLRIFIRGIEDYAASPDRKMIVDYIENTLKLNSNFFKYEEIPAASSILIFFKALGRN